MSRRLSLRTCAATLLRVPSVGLRVQLQLLPRRLGAVWAWSFDGHPLHAQLCSRLASLQRVLLQREPLTAISSHVSRNDDRMTPQLRALLVCAAFPPQWMAVKGLAAVRVSLSMLPPTDEASAPHAARGTPSRTRTLARPQACRVC
eukprot:6184712-Pleurochrysis_carterae.AAC.1